MKPGSEYLLAMLMMLSATEVAPSFASSLAKKSPQQTEGARFRQDPLTSSSVTVTATVTVMVTESVDEVPELPTSFSLAQNYPNPFNSTTRIPYSLGTRAHVQLEVFNSLGQRIEVLVDETQEMGEYTYTWSHMHPPSGVWYYRLQAGTFSQTRMMHLLK